MTRPRAWALCALALCFATSAAAFPVPVDPNGPGIVEGFAWADDPTGSTAPSLFVPSGQSGREITGSIKMDFSGGDWSFGLKGGGINHSGLTPAGVSFVNFNLVHYTGSVPVQITPVAGGRFLVEQTASTLATVEIPNENLFVVTGNQHNLNPLT